MKPLAVCVITVDMMFACTTGLAAFLVLQTAVPPPDVAPPGEPSTTAPSPTTTVPSTDAVADAALVSAEAPVIVAADAPASGTTTTITTTPADGTAGRDVVLVTPPSPLWINSDENLVWLHARAELGSLAVLSHTIQFGSDGTAFDYVAAGGQNNLYLFARLEGEAVIARRHIVQLTYQPIDVRTEVKLDDDLRVFDTQFAAGTPMKLRYGFDFVRTTYLFDFLDDAGDELAIGAGLQVRNAVIDFADSAGSELVSNRNIGPVPILSARGRATFDDGALAGMFVGAEVSGFWASGRIITGSTNDFEGAILDTSVRAGVPVTSFANLYVVARVIGGGARGVEEDSNEPGDGFTENWLWTGSIAVGAELF